MNDLQVSKLIELRYIYYSQHTLCPPIWHFHINQFHFVVEQFFLTIYLLFFWDYTGHVFLTRPFLLFKQKAEEGANKSWTDISNSCFQVPLTNKWIMTLLCSWYCWTLYKVLRSYYPPCSLSLKFFFDCKTCLVQESNIILFGPIWFCWHCVFIVCYNMVNHSVNSLLVIKSFGTSPCVERRI